MPGLALVVAACALSLPVSAQTDAQEPAADTKVEAQTDAASEAPVSVDLNKIEQADAGCRVYLVVNNASATAYEALTISLYWFRSDGVIGGDLLFNLAPIEGKKILVKQYILQGKQCDEIASLLLNDVTECKTDAGTVSECKSKINVSSRTNVKVLN